ncbi:glycine betaine/L-proline ABC transporter permease ProW [Halarcobacter bivalviorum]|uniref:Proline/glycine betaine ABC transporter ProVWX, permease protein ProW n=1 Tax=Halarcobacter bivalviorum TaxID=663364 RepID=A0AAX2AAT4_9BACT|nr:glycine betaine/L-proline ABC transporter permease ProW [Halarcobacter bivalviorum]AXH12530.1 proline/glycine betaine ABC transporter ProVWX, permease protein ProW [Halarcobacter bivalviorum]RXK10546.1 proline/glycine betaine ABC transporter permease ProW [Halarcobacter bivalviorum]
MSNDPWGNASTAQENKESSVDWMNTEVIEEKPKEFDFFNPFEQSLIPFDTWTNNSIDWLVANFREFFLATKIPIDIVLKAIEGFLLYLNPYVVILFFVFLALQFSTKKMAIGTLISFLIIGFIGAWEEAMITLALVITAVVFSLFIGIPLGIWSAKSETVNKIVRPILDAMQTTPAFVYLIPIVMLFGIGNVPGVIVTIIFALPPLIRLTNLGIRQVPEDLIEASRSFGASSMQMLFKVQIPVAMPTIMAGINQTLMLALSMVVIASMIAVGGLGQMVLRGIGRLDVGLAAVGGLGIVLLAVILDRLTQEMGKRDKNDKRKWFEKGPIGFFYKLLNKEK